MGKLNSILDFVVLTVGEHDITIGLIVLIPTVIVLGYLLAGWGGRILRRRMARANMAPDMIHLVSRVYLVVIIAALGITVLDLLRIPLAAFAFISGAVAIGIGFGAQNIINNFISGWILMWERPIRIGDFLEVGETKGTVEAINTRSTRIKRVDGVHLLIPNSYLLENTVVNWTLVDRLTRTVVRVGVAYGSPVRQVADLIQRALTEHASVLAEPPAMVIFEDFGDNALIFDAYFWVEASAERDIRLIRSDIRFRINELFNEHGIVIAFPQRDVHIDRLEPIEVRIIDGAGHGAVR